MLIVCAHLEIPCWTPDHIYRDYLIEKEFKSIILRRRYAVHVYIVKHQYYRENVQMSYKDTCVYMGILSENCDSGFRSN